MPPAHQRPPAADGPARLTGRSASISDRGTSPASNPETGDVVGDFSPAGGHPDGETFHRRDHILYEQRGKPLVLAFHPGDDTPVRTAQLCSCSGGLDQFQAAGATVWGIGAQGLDAVGATCPPAAALVPQLARLAV
ncbi:redoxin domain-containing protein [Streptomyces hydrogenans]|uniref:redoxin domain-containing protein n=1 Tax=Streptomyces hydrogenans TaxID=1873719 RepID=UPI00382A7B4D